jgi:hypothetical protein
MGVVLLGPPRNWASLTWWTVVPLSGNGFFQGFSQSINRISHHQFTFSIVVSTNWKWDIQMDINNTKSDACKLLLAPPHKEKHWKGAGIKPQNWLHYARTQLKQCWILNTQNTRFSTHIHSIFRTPPGQGIYTDFNNNNDNLDLTHTHQNFIQHTSTIFQYRWLQVLSPRHPQICRFA